MSKKWKKLRVRRRQFDRKSYRFKESIYNGEDFYPCEYCGMLISIEQSTLDHIISIMKTEVDILNNLLLTCKICNHTRGSILFEEFKPIAIFAWYERILQSLRKLDRVVEFKNSSPQLCLREPIATRLISKHRTEINVLQK